MNGKRKLNFTTSIICSISIILSKHIFYNKLYSYLVELFTHIRRTHTLTAYKNK